ncbi:hypothetical protein LBMAG53_02200 [Planctomycetota bacterium]|nr:hypothetical protein LBMAG53_02200 [Planctomycetota bacterium]
MRDLRTHVTSAMTLIEIAISLGIVAIAVLSILALLPAALRTQEINRYKIYAAAKAVDLIERFHKNTFDFNEIPRATTVMPNAVTALGNNSIPTNKHTIHDLDLVNYTGSAITERRVFSQANAPDLENVINTPDSGNLPMPPEIARRLDSPDDTIRKLVDGGGTLWYADPTAEAFSAKRARMSGTSRSVTSDMSKLVWGVITPPQQNAIPYHPFIEPQRRLYPCPPTEYTNAGDTRHDLPSYSTADPRVAIICEPFARMPDGSFADGTGGKPKIWLPPAERSAYVILVKEASDGFYFPTISLRQSKRGGDGPMTCNWIWFAYAEAREAFEQSPRLDVGANKSGSSPWLTGYYEWERMRRFHWERIVVQTRRFGPANLNTNWADPNIQKGFANPDPTNVIWVNNPPPVGAPAWFYLDGPPDPNGNPTPFTKVNWTTPSIAQSTSNVVPPSPPIGLGISGLRGSDILEEDSECWRGDHGMKGSGQASLYQIGDRDAQLRFGIPGLQRRIMYRTAAMMLWARVKPLFPPAENVSTFYDRDQPMRFNPVDITSMPARKLSGIATIDGAIWSPTGSDTLIAPELPPDPNIADLAGNLPDAENPLLSILPVPPGDKIHPTQIYALNAIAHAARIVTGYRPPFINDNNTSEAGDDTVVAPSKTVYPHRPYDENCWDIQNWWEKDVMMPPLAENDTKLPLWVELCTRLNQSYVGPTGNLLGYESPRRDSKRWLCWHLNPFLEQTDFSVQGYIGNNRFPKGGTFFQDGSLFSPLIPLPVTEATDVESTSTLGFLKRAFMNLPPNVNAPRDQPLLQSIPIAATTQHALTDRVQQKCGIGYFRKAPGGIVSTNPPPFADRGVFDWAGRRTSKLRYHWFCKQKTDPPAWSGSTPANPPTIPANIDKTYALMERVKNHGKIYECVRSGKAAYDASKPNPLSAIPVGTGPDGSGTSIADREVLWSYVGSASGAFIYRCIIDPAANGGAPMTGDTDPAGMAAKSLSPNDPASDTRMARIALENCLRWTYAYTAARPHDCIVPKPLNIQLAVHQPLYCFDPYRAASGAPTVPNRTYGTGPTNFWDFFQICGHPQGFVQTKRRDRPFGTWNVWQQYEYYQYNYVAPASPPSPVVSSGWKQNLANAIVIDDPASPLYQARVNPANPPSASNTPYGLHSEDANNFVGSCGFHFPSSNYSPPLSPYATAPNVLMPKLQGPTLGLSTIMTDTDARTPLNELRPYTSATTAAVYQYSYFGYFGNNSGPNSPLNPYLRQEAFSQMTVKATADTPRHQTVLGRSFDPSHRTRVMTFWAVDWQQYEDAESAQSAPIDASRVPPILTSMYFPRIGRYSAAGPGDPQVVNLQTSPGNVHWYGSLFGLEGGEFTGALNDGFASVIGNPERALCWMTPRRDGTVYRPPNRNKTNDVPLNGIVHRVDNDYPGVVYLKDVSAGFNVEHRMYPPQALGLFGADRNGNGVFDRGPVPATQRMRAVEVGRVVFYDPVAWTTLGR